MHMMVLSCSTNNINQICHFFGYNIGFTHFTDNYCAYSTWINFWLYTSPDVHLQNTKIIFHNCWCDKLCFPVFVKRVIRKLGRNMCPTRHIAHYINNAFCIWIQNGWDVFVFQKQIFGTRCRYECQIVL